MGRGPFRGGGTLSAVGKAAEKFVKIFQTTSSYSAPSTTSDPNLVVNLVRAANLSDFRFVPEYWAWTSDVRFSTSYVCCTSGSRHSDCGRELPLLNIPLEFGRVNLR